MSFILACFEPKIHGNKQCKKIEFSIRHSNDVNPPLGPTFKVGLPVPVAVHSEFFSGWDYF